MPLQNGPPLNFFIDPYVEVDGRVHDGFEMFFRFDALEVMQAGSPSEDESGDVVR